MRIKDLGSHYLRNKIMWLVLTEPNLEYFDINDLVNVHSSVRDYVIKSVCPITVPMNLLESSLDLLNLGAEPEIWEGG